MKTSRSRPRDRSAPREPPQRDDAMTDAPKLIARAESLIARLEAALAPASSSTDWHASIAFRWRKKHGYAAIEPVSHVHRIRLRDLQGIDEQKQLVEQNTRQF